MVIFSHRGIGFGPQENSLEALKKAVENGFSVEVDLRIIKNNIVLSHDFNSNKPLADFEGLLKLIRDNPDVNFALHLKEDSPALFNTLADAIKGFNNCFLFMTDFAQGNFITSCFEKLGSSQLAMYANDATLDPALLVKVDYLWLDETKSALYRDLGFFFRDSKKIICCSPELFMKDYLDRLDYLKEEINRQRGKIFGVCTDFTGQYSGD